MELVPEEESRADTMDPGHTLSEITVGVMVITMVIEAVVRLCLFL